MSYHNKKASVSSSGPPPKAKISSEWRQTFLTWAPGYFLLPRCPLCTGRDATMVKTRTNWCVVSGLGERVGPFQGLGERMGAGSGWQLEVGG